MRVVKQTRVQAWYLPNSSFPGKNMQTHNTFWTIRWQTHPWVSFQQSSLIYPWSIQRVDHKNWNIFFYYYFKHKKNREKVRPRMPKMTILDCLDLFSFRQCPPKLYPSKTWAWVSVINEHTARSFIPTFLLSVFCFLKNHRETWL